MRRTLHPLVHRTLACALAFVLAAPSMAVASAPTRLAGGVKTIPAGKGEAAKVRPTYVPGEVIVRFRASSSASQRSAANRHAGGVSSERIGRSTPGLMRVKLHPGVAVADAVAAYTQQPGVLYAQPNFLKHVEATPSDPRFAELWGMNNTGQSGGTVDADIDAPEAWNVTTGSQEVTVAVIDTGIDYTHPELSANAWTNPGEIAVNGLDDDHNGYVDDVHGWDAVNSDGDPMDDHGHGTHVSGTIGASANNGVGVAGVNWHVKLVGIKMLAQNGSGTSADELEAFDYARAIGARVISCSWGGYSTTVDTAEYQKIQSLDALVVCAAGNETNNNDVSRTVAGENGYHYPSSYDLPNIVAVGATDRKDAVSSFSNYGATSVDLFAPGSSILSTIPGRQLQNTATSVFSDGMDSLGNWSSVHVDGEVTNPWSLATSRFASGPTSAGNLNYQSGAWDGLELNSGLNLAAEGAPGYGLTFNTWYDVEPDDTLWIWARSDQRTWDIVGFESGTSNGFVQEAVDLSAFASDTGVKISFDLDSLSYNSSTANGEGVYVDDVKVFKQQWVTDYPNAYATWDGTSMATPHVSGAAALLLSADPSLTVAEMRAALLQSVDTKPGLSGKCVTGGRLNAAKALDAAAKGAVVQGAVTSGGVGLGGVTVNIGTETTTTAANGAYRMTNLEPGTRTISFEKTHYGSVSKQVTLAFGTAVTVNAALQRNPGGVEGTVRDAGTNAGLSGVLVSVAGASTVTGSDGTYSLSGIAPGSYGATFTKSGYADAIADVTVSSDQTSTLDATLIEGPGSIEGVVRSGGAPLAGATVAVAGKTDTTAEDGSYSFTGIAPGSHDVAFSKVHYGSTTLTVEVSSYATATLDATLVANSGSVRGVVQAGGAVLPGVTVTVAGKSALTGSDGVYTVEGVSPGTHSVSFSRAGYQSTSRNATVVSDTQTRLDVSLSALSGSVGGVVTDAGVGVAGVLVNVGGAVALTGADGSFWLNLPVGSYAFTISRSGYVGVSGTLDVAGAATTVLNTALTRIVPKASIVRSPSKSSVTFRRTRGVARYTLAATVRGWGSAPLARRTVYLQTSKNGKTGWKSTYKITASSTGKASKSFRVTTKGTRYYRWYVPARSQVNLKTYSTTQKVVIK